MSPSTFGERRGAGPAAPARTAAPPPAPAATQHPAGRRPAGDFWRYVLVVGALGNLANGVWMLADAPGWFTGIPAAVPDFGPLNEHFVRDLGSVFVMLGIGMLWAALVPALRVPLVALITLFYVLHALVHVYDTARGLVGPAHWAIDVPAVYFPAVFLVIVLGFLARHEPSP